MFYELQPTTKIKVMRSTVDSLEDVIFFLKFYFTVNYFAFIQGVITRLEISKTCGLIIEFRYQEIPGGKISWSRLALVMTNKSLVDSFGDVSLQNIRQFLVVLLHPSYFYFIQTKNSFKLLYFMMLV